MHLYTALIETASALTGVIQPGQTVELDKSVGDQLVQAKVMKKATPTEAKEYQKRLEETKQLVNSGKKTKVVDDSGKKTKVVDDSGKKTKVVDDSGKKTKSG